MNKRGQFYIIAAIIIVLALATMASIKTYTVTKSKPETITDIGKMLNLEGSKVVDYGIYKGDPAALDKFQTQVVQPYFVEKLEGAEIVLAYKSEEDIKITSIKSTSGGSIESGLGTNVVGSTETTTTVLSSDQFAREPTSGGRERITLNLLNQETSFELGNNEIFYFMIAQQQEGERYVETKTQPKK